MRSSTIDLGGPVHVADFGGNGPPLVLLHGLGGSHLNWQSVGPALAERCHTLALDLPGHGLTAIADREASIDAFVRLLGRALQRLAPAPAVLVGNSMGGLIALGTAVAQPELVAGLVLVDPALPPVGWRPRLDPVGLRFLMAFALPQLAASRLRRYVAAAGPEALVRQTLALCAVDPRSIDPEVVAAHVELERQRTGTPGWELPVYTVARSLVRMLTLRRRVEDWIRRVSVPTLLLHGREDRVVSVKSARAAFDMRPDWTYCEMAGVGHVPQLEAPQEFVDLVTAWLTQTLRSTIAEPWGVAKR